MDTQQHQSIWFREAAMAASTLLDTATSSAATAPDSPNKWGLSFILNASAAEGARPPPPESAIHKTLNAEEKRRRRMCKVAGCTKYIVQMGRCCRHGVSRTVDSRSSDFA
jgi:hypothetical protein